MAPSDLGLTASRAQAFAWDAHAHGKHKKKMVGQNHNIKEKNNPRKVKQKHTKKKKKRDGTASTAICTVRNHKLRGQSGGGERTGSR